MLAGYLPFDDDPANPEGDNINLLYKYIVSTPLTFPEYVTPHARDLLKRILVPDPRKRADLFEVARHSWLSDYVHVVGFITSSTTTTKDISNTTVNSSMSKSSITVYSRLTNLQVIHLNCLHRWPEVHLCGSQASPTHLLSPLRHQLRSISIKPSKLTDPQANVMPNAELCKSSMWLLPHRQQEGSCPLRRPFRLL